MRRLTALILLGFAAVAAAQDTTVDRGRQAEADRTLKEFHVRAAKLPPPPEVLRTQLPVPAVWILDFASELRDFARLNADLTSASIDARKILIKARAATGDVAGQLAEIRALLDEFAAELPAKTVASLRGESARQRHRFGDLDGALEDIAAVPAADLPVDLVGKASEWEAERSQLVAELQELRRGLQSPEAAPRRRAEMASQRFALTHPLHRESAPVLLAILAESKPGDAGRAELAERIAFFAPELETSPQLTLEVLPLLVDEGEYEKSLLHARRLLDHSERIPGEQVAPLTSLVKELRARLQRVAARDLEPGRATKGLRLEDLRREGRNVADAWIFAERVRGFVEDYPKASANAELEWLSARTLLAASPADAREPLERLARRHADRDEGRRALDELCKVIEGAEGVEGKLDWLDNNAAAFKGAAGRQVQFERALCLDRLDRWEDAAAALEPLAAQTEDAAIAARARTQLDAIRAKLEGR